MLLLRIICRTDMKGAIQQPVYRAVLFEQQRAMLVFVPSNMTYKHKLQYSAFLCFPIYLPLTLASLPLYLALSSCVLLLP
jgi:hypothetical protein